MKNSPNFFLKPCSRPDWSLWQADSGRMFAPPVINTNLSYSCLSAGSNHTGQPSLPICIGDPWLSTNLSLVHPCSLDTFPDLDTWILTPTDCRHPTEQQFWTCSKPSITVLATTSNTYSISFKDVLCSSVSETFKWINSAFTNGLGLVWSSNAAGLFLQQLLQADREDTVTFQQFVPYCTHLLIMVSVCVCVCGPPPRPDRPSCLSTSWQVQLQRRTANKDEESPAFNPPACYRCSQICGDGVTASCSHAWTILSEAYSTSACQAEGLLGHCHCLSNICSCCVGQEITSMENKAGKTRFQHKKRKNVYKYIF